MVEIIGKATPQNEYLLDQDSRNRLPKFYGLDSRELGLKAKAVVKFVAPDTNWIWYASEFDGEDLFYGLIVCHEPKVGFFSLSELESLNDALGIIVERDPNFE